MTDLPDLEDVDGAYDAAAAALAAELDALLETLSLRDACETLLRSGFLGGGPGGYCVRAPREPHLAALGRLGSRIVELSYTVREPKRAWREARDMMRDTIRQTWPPDA